MAHGSGLRAQGARARALEFTPDTFLVHLEDGCSLTVPLELFSRLWDATPDQRAHYEMVGRGLAIHWPDLDEDISVPCLLGMACYWTIAGADGCRA